MLDSLLAALPPTLVDVLPELWDAIGETLVMMGVGLSAAVLLGGPLGIWLFLLSPGQSMQNPVLFAIVSWLVNMVRSFPFVILLVALVPFTRWLVGTSIGPMAASVPLACAAIPYFARLVEQSLREVPRGVIEAAHAMCCWWKPARALCSRWWCCRSASCRTRPLPVWWAVAVWAIWPSAMATSASRTT